MDSEEIKTFEAEVVENEKLSKKNVFHDERGKFVKGNSVGGRPRGILNQYSQLKADLLDAWKSEGGKEMVKKLFHGGSRSQNLELIKVMISLLPKESLVDLQATINPPKVVIYKEMKEKKVEEPK